MQKNSKYYTFLLSHSFKSKIYIRRIEVSKKALHTTGFTAVFLVLGFVSFGLFGLVNDSAIAKSKALIPNETALISQQPVQNQNIQTSETDAELSSLNYDRPQDGENFSVNSGGPASSFQLTMVESEDEHNQIESELRRIEATSSGAFLPTIWAHFGKINNEFGFRRNPFGGRTYEFHAGMDIDGERGDSVIAAANGTIIKAEWQGGYGNMIEIDHGNGLITRYGHLSKIEITVGDVVQRGQLIGLVGSTGRSTGPHLHYELRLNDKAINPRRFLPPEPVEIAKLINK
jgi:murein DD-endopeptidase MepM/ murein hydrolase activator NlpD